MTVLADWQIRKRVLSKNLIIDPFVDYGQCPEEVISYGLTSGGYDLRVGTHFLLFSNTSACVVDPKNFQKENFTEVNTEIGKKVVIPPNCFALAETVEYISMPKDLIAEIKGKSRLARAGYVMPTTPIEPGWRGVITLEIGNLSPLPMAIYAGEGIGQLIFYRLDALPERDYDNKPNRRFQDQKGLTGPEGVWKPSSMSEETKKLNELDLPLEERPCYPLT